MKIKFIKTPLLVISAVAILFLLSSSGGNGSGGGKGGVGGGKHVGGKGGGTIQPCGDMKCDLYLPISFDRSLASVSNRIMPSFMPIENILNGSQKNSTNSLYEEQTKNFCMITISATECSGYGTITFLWSSDGAQGCPKMTLSIPESSPFTLKVELYEGCGPWYQQNVGRAHFQYEGMLYPSSSIILNEDDFIYQGFVSCSECL